MKIIVVTFYLIASSVNCQSHEIVEYNWLWGKDTLGVINVPSDFDTDNWQYGEGLVTTLSYPDSSYIILHLGGNIQLPFMNEPEHSVINKLVSENVSIRKGIVGNNLFWREHNYINMLNIAYSNVSKSKMEIYDQVLESFVFLRK